LHISSAHHHTNCSSIWVYRASACLEQQHTIPCLLLTTSDSSHSPPDPLLLSPPNLHWSRSSSTTSSYVPNPQAPLLSSHVTRIHGFLWYHVESSSHITHLLGFMGERERREFRCLIPSTNFFSFLSFCMYKIKLHSSPSTDPYLPKTTRLYKSSTLIH
jgi:hypothetical protein